MIRRVDRAVVGSHEQDGGQCGAEGARRDKGNDVFFNPPHFDDGHYLYVCNPSFYWSSSLVVVSGNLQTGLRVKFGEGESEFERVVCTCNTEDTGESPPFISREFIFSNLLFMSYHQTCHLGLGARQFPPRLCTLLFSYLSDILSSLLRCLL